MGALFLILDSGNMIAFGIEFFGHCDVIDRTGPYAQLAALAPFHMKFYMSHIQTEYKLFGIKLCIVMQGEPN
jgi:hypothetical protein